jgi:hypothetical protein
MTLRRILLGAPFLVAGILALLAQWWLRGGVPRDLSTSWWLTVAAAAAVLAALGECATAAPLRGERAGTAWLAGAGALALLLFGAGAEVLSFRLVAGPDATVERPDLGIVLGVLFLAALGGTLLHAADRLAPGASALAPVVARRLLMLAGALGVIAVGLVARAAFAGEIVAPLASVGAGLVGVTWLLAAGTAAELVDPPAGDAAVHDAHASRWTALGAMLSCAALLANGLEAWREQGSYLAGGTRLLLVAALAGFAAVQPTRWRWLRAVLFAGLLVAAGVARF